MSSPEFAEVLAELGRGDEVAVSERLKAAAAALASTIDELPAIDGQLTDERVIEVLDLVSPLAQSFLTVSYPAIEYGRTCALDALPQALLHIALATAATRTDQAATRIAAVPALGRITWALTAYALHCDRLDVLAVLDSAKVIVPFTNEEVQAIIALTELRYPDALRGSAFNSFRDYHDWLRELPLLERRPLFMTRIEEVFLEGDLILAMLTGRDEPRVHSVGHTRSTARRFRLRCLDSSQRQSLEQLFPGEGDLESRLERAYSSVEGDSRRYERGPTRLFNEKE